MADAGGQQVLSPYHAMACNPVSMVDPLGLEPLAVSNNVDMSMWNMAVYYRSIFSSGALQSMTTGFISSESNSKLEQQMMASIQKGLDAKAGEKIMDQIMDAFVALAVSGNYQKGEDDLSAQVNGGSNSNGVHNKDGGNSSTATGKASVYIETDGVGHVYVETDGVVYSYGRYNGSYSPSSGKFGPYGDGVLLRLEGDDAANFIAERTAKYPTSVFSVGVDVDKVKSYYDKLYNSGEPLQGKEGSYKYGRVIDVYTLVGPGGNNCTTIAYKALNYGGANMGAPQTPAGMLYNFQQAEYIRKGYNPGLWGPKR